ncbi:MAG: lytic transglycosylase domain-containing protein [Synechococcaceae cyanobacterium]|nr:lytic transglycosylase domain-containing protein [Synechococcaceae cyanobacterium]
MTPRRTFAWSGLGLAALLVGCGTPLASGSPSAAVAPPKDAPAAVALPTAGNLPRAADGRHYPLLPAAPAAVAALLAQLETTVRDPATPEAQMPALGHQQQVIYRVLAHRPAQAAAVRAQLPESWRPVFDRHLRARREFLAMHRLPRPARLPAWRIIAPEPPENLLRYYREAAAATGIPWQVLAAVNLVESGMGRIDGVSVADAHGPMQFLPSTWAEPGIGNGGDIRDPRTAIHAAARYLVRRGGLRDIRQGLWGYNNSNHYGRGVLEYAALLKEDPAAYRGLYHWEIHYAADGGDVWLPQGYRQSRPIAVAAYLQQAPASRPPQGSSGY